MMKNRETVVDVAQHVATITLNRPDKLNAWTSTMEQEVREAIETAERDDNVRVIVLTGAGRGFCAGADITLLSSAGERAAAVDSSATPGRRRIYSCFPDVGKPIIAAINGPAVGLGLVIALYCDLRFASSNARFSTTFARRGLIAEHGIAWLLPRVVGLSNAADLLYSARMINASEAQRMGLVNQVFTQEEFSGKVLEYARELGASVSPRSLAIMKRQIYGAMTETLAEALEIADREMLESFKCADFREGVAHFLEKRPARFTGK